MITRVWDDLRLNEFYSSLVYNMFAYAYVYGYVTSVIQPNCHIN